MNTSDLDYYFDGLDVKALNHKESEKIWDLHIKSKHPSYFKLEDTNWLIEANQVSVEFWFDDFNNNCSQRIHSLLDENIDWNSSDVVYYTLSKYLIYKTTWNLFKANWIKFLECEDDCPILINESSKSEAIIFTPLGELRYLKW
jgi:hypothetical protein